MTQKRAFGIHRKGLNEPNDKCQGFFSTEGNMKGLGSLVSVLYVFIYVYAFRAILYNENLWTMAMSTWGSFVVQISD